MGWSTRFSRRRLVQGSATALAVAAVPEGFTQPAEPEPGSARFGINLDGPADYNTEQAFANVFRQSRPWISQRERAEWGSGPELDIDEFGWVRRLERNCYAETLLCTIRGGHYPSGRYAVLYDGTGELGFSSNVSVRSREQGRVMIDVDASRNGFRCSIRETDPDDYVRNIRILMPDLHERTDAEPFRPSFLNRWRGAACLRFMDWMETNDSPIVDWSQRPTLDHASFSRRGVPVETMITLANDLQADPWFCMPHRASDDYVRNFAVLVRDRLDAGLRAYVEYSNEVWNSVFDQFEFAFRQGERLGFGSNRRRAAARYAANRSREIFSIWQEVFGATDRFVRVLASQAASTEYSEDLIEFRQASRDADVLAIAPYMACNVHPSRGIVQVAEFAGWSVDQVLDFVEQYALPQASNWMAEQKALADRHGLGLVGYEAGQHMVAIGAANQIDAVNEMIADANVHPRMGEIYDKYYDAWTGIGGGVICHYTSVRESNHLGSWGLLNFDDETAADSPKFQASVRWAQARGQSMSL